VLAVVFGRFLGVLILVPGRYLKAFCSWILVPGVRVLGVASQGVASQALLVLGIASQGVASPGHCRSWSLLVLVVAGSGPGSFRLTRLLRVVAGELRLASCG
jgi:hypothetical protein